MGDAENGGRSRNRRLARAVAGNGSRVRRLARTVAGNGSRVRGLAAAAAVLLGGCLMGYAVVVSPGELEPQGWTPVNEEVRAALAEGAAEGKEEARASDQAAKEGTVDAGTGPESSAKRDDSVTKEAARDGASEGNTSESPRGGASIAGSQETAEEVNVGKLDLNTATEAELDELPGIGPAKAEAIAAYRAAHGAFRSVDELANVKGIGSKMLDRIRPLVFVPR